MINAIAVDRKLLGVHRVRRCDLNECQALCCGTGVWVDVKHAREILAHKELILPHVAPDRRDTEKWFDWNLEPDLDHPDGGMLASTNAVEDLSHPARQNCVFLRADRKCALQVAGNAAGNQPLRFKPYYCALYPLTFSERRLALDEEYEAYHEGGNCQRPSCGEPVAIFRLFEMEMKLALGDAGYAELEKQANAAGDGQCPRSTLDR